MKKDNSLLFITIGLILLLGILAIGDLDYRLSELILNRKSTFGYIFEMFGGLPAIIAILLSISILFGSRKKEVLIFNILKIITIIPLMTLLSFLIVFTPIGYIYKNKGYSIPQNIIILVMILSIILLICILIIVRKIGRKRLKKYRKHGLFLLCLVICEMFIVNILKIIWARPRMRSIESITQFKKWYEINGPINYEEFKSFPSGHTANSFTIIAYTIFLSKEKVIKRLKYFAVTWGVCTGISRIIIGAHFLSDVAVGGYITIFLFYILSGYIFKISDYSFKKVK